MALIETGERNVKTRNLLAAWFVLSLCANGAYAAEITLVAPGGAKAAMDALLPVFEKQTGNTVKATFGSGLGTKKQAAQGIFDVSIAQPPYPDVLASPDVDVKSQTPLASVAVAVAVKKGSPRPDISSADAVKKMLLAAKSVTYPDSKGGAAAGVSFDATLKQMGIADQIGAKIKRAQGGAGAMALVANGSVEIGLTFASEMQDPGIDVVGPLPASISPPTQLVGFVSAHSQHADVARALLKFLSGPAAANVYRAQGMQPMH
jgi:molybdate transport system substrate-binding protein